MITRADIAREALDLSKATFDNVFLSLAALQGIAEDLVLDSAGKWPWLPGEIEQILREGVGLAQRTRGDVKDTVDRCHALLHALIDRTSAADQHVRKPAAPTDAAAIH
jgi:hypothetical protein